MIRSVLAYLILGTFSIAEQPNLEPERPPANLKRDGAFGFPQTEARVLHDSGQLRVSIWNDAEHIYVQAVVWADENDSLGETEDGRTIGDWSNLSLDVDADGKETPKVDRKYSLSPWPSLPGLRYQVVVGQGATTGIQDDSKGRGAIRYVATEGDTNVRVDSFLIPLMEIRKMPGATVRLAYWASSPAPDLTLNSIGFEKEGTYYSYHLPIDKYHEVKLAKGNGALDPNKVPDGRSDSVPFPKREVKPMPVVGSQPPEVFAKDWINADSPRTLASLKGKVVLVDFWATWCGPCIAGIPHLNELQNKHKVDGLVILSFTDQSRRGIEEFLEKTPIHYAIGTGSDLAAEYGVTGIPHAFLIGRDGKLLWHGNPSSEAFDTQLTSALAAENGKRE